MTTGGRNQRQCPVHFMHFMPYTHLPPNHKDFRSLWVDFPNKYFDPERGYELISTTSPNSFWPTG